MNVSVYERFRRSQLGRRLTRYMIGSIVAAATSALVFALAYLLGLATTTCSVIAFVAGAIPNWVLNRRWAWQLSGRVALGREVIAYIAISVLSLLATSAATAWTSHQVRTFPGDLLRAGLVTTSYVAVFAVLFVAKFWIYNAWIFSGRSLRVALRSRRQVWIAARANRTP